MKVLTDDVVRSKCVLCTQAIDLQPEEPATVLHHSKHTSLRERLLLPAEAKWVTP